MTKGWEAGSVVWKSLRRFDSTSLKVLIKGWPTWDSLQRLDTTSSMLDGVWCIPVVAHGLQDIIVELNGARDEQGGVSCLLRHFDGCLCFSCTFSCRRRLWRSPGLDEVALFVDKACTSFSRKGSVQLEEGLWLEMSREKVEARGCS